MNGLRCNAKRRGHDFTITLNQFEAFCRRTGYMKYKGRFAECMSLDRIKNHLGYHIWNMTVLSVSANSIKRDRESYLPHNQPDYVPAN